MAPKTPQLAGTAPEIGGIVVCALCRECSGYNTSRGERSSRLPVEAFSAPGARAVCGLHPARKADQQECEMKNSPYLDKPLVPLATALRSMLAETEAKIAAASPAEQARLQEWAVVLREWITPKSITPRST
jgi:hypothetical protein